MKKVLVAILALLMILCGCGGSSSGKIFVESREYSSGGTRIEYSHWVKTDAPATAGSTIFNSEAYNINIILVSTDSKGARVRFSTPIFCKTTEKNGDVFYLEKNRTYNFVTSNTIGIEIKLRFS